MKPAVLLSNNYFLALAFMFGWTVDESHSCDTKWIRLVYMMSCGKKKRESVWARNDTFYENLPSDFDGAYKYFKQRDPFNPVLSDALLYEIVEEDNGKNPRVSHQVPKLLLYGEETTKQSTNTAEKSTSILIKKLSPSKKQNNQLGIQGFPEQWDIEEIIDEKINDNHRREIDRLIEECCKVPPVTTCNANTFSGACK